MRRQPIRFLFVLRKYRVGVDAIGVRRRFWLFWRFFSRFVGVFRHVSFVGSYIWGGPVINFWYFRLYFSCGFLFREGLAPGSVSCRVGGSTPR